MRDFSPLNRIDARIRDPRLVVGIIYSGSAIYLTNRTGISNVPTTALHGVLTDISTTSQELFPDQGRSTIGSMSFRVLDLSNAFSAELRSRLATGEGVKGKEVRVFTGDTDDFDDFDRVETYVVDDAVSFDGRSYLIRCSDRSREQRVTIFEPKTTRLSSTITDSQTTIPVKSTSGFEMVAHTTSFGDAPSSTVGYALIKKTGEIFRYTSKSAAQFSGVTRQVFNTVAQEVVVEATDADRAPEIIEVVYLEMAAPDLLHAIQTGENRAGTMTLPAGWHMGIDTTAIDTDAYDTIGDDLFDPSDPTAGLVLRFLQVKKTDGKKFAEEQLHYVMGTFAPVLADGRLSLRRMASIVSDAQPLLEIGPSELISHGPVTHNQARLVNQIRIDWNWNGDRYTRSNLFFSAGSYAEHGKSKLRVVELLGLSVTRHTTSTLRRIFASILDRYGSPPIEVPLTLSRRMIALETGDTVRVALPRLPDYAGPSSLSRTFELQGMRKNWRTGRVIAKAFGSTSRFAVDVGSSSGPILADSWYSAVGTELSTVLTISGGAITANGSLTGNADGSLAIYYYLGDLTLNSGVTISIDNNVRLYVRGTFTRNGTIDGAGAGLPAIADINTVSSPRVYPTHQQTVATLGATRGSDGIVNYGSSFWSMFGGAAGLFGKVAMSPYPLSVDSSGNLTGLPTDLRGTPGIYGTPAIQQSGSGVTALGGAGGAGGAGLVLVCRGFVNGLSGSIDLSGGDGSAPASSASMGGHNCYGGAGGGGAAGGLLVVVDGEDVALPDLTGSLTVDHGATPQTGNPIGIIPPDPFPGDPLTGKDPGIGSQDMFSANHLIQYVPTPTVTGASDDEIVPQPSNLVGVGDGVAAVLAWVNPPAGKFDAIEVWQSDTNDRGAAVPIARVNTNTLTVPSASATAKYFWIRAVRLQIGQQSSGYSAWEPLSSTAGVPVVFGGAANTARWGQIAGGAPIDEMRDDMLYADGDDLEMVWTQRSGGVPNSEIVALTGLTDAPGGRALRFGNNSGDDQWWGAFTDFLIPYDGVSLYEVGIIVRRGAGTGVVYCGLEGVAADGVTMINAAGADTYSSQHYLAASGQSPASSWTSYRGFVQGHSGSPLVTNRNDPQSPGQMYTGVVYVRPVFICNYSGLAGQTDVAAIWVRRIPGGLAALGTEAAIDVLNTTNAPSEANADNTASNGQAATWLTSLIAAAQINAASVEAVLDALNLLNAPAESGADVTGTNYSALDWDDDNISSFSGSYVGVSSITTTFYYQRTKDGTWARMWTTAYSSGNMTSTGPYINNLPSVIRPAGTTFLRFQHVMGLVTNATQDPAMGACRIAGASHASAGIFQFTLLDSNSELRPDTWNGSGTFAIHEGWEQIWPL